MMILADKISLLRKKNGWSQEELAEKLGVSRQSISKWEGAQSTPDLNKVLKLSEIFGVSTDVLLRDEQDLETVPENMQSEAPVEQLYNVTMEQANQFLSLKTRSSGRIALGVMLCILSPIPLILCSVAQEVGRIQLTENQAAGIGILVLMLMVGAAVAIFIHYGMKTGPFEYMEKEPLETEYGVDGMVRERKERYNDTYMRYMVIGIVLCVLSCIPLFIAMIINDNDFNMALGVSILLVMVALGVLMIIRVNIVMNAMKMLLEEGDYSRANKQENKRNGLITEVYWMSVTAFYLLVSFLTKRWDMTWLVWPIAGICYGILIAILKMMHSKE